MALLQKAWQPFNVNAIAQAAALAALADTQHTENTRRVNLEGMSFYEKAFRERGLEYVPSHANFLLVKTGNGDELFREMLKQGVIVSAMSYYKLPDWIRLIGNCFRGPGQIVPGRGAEMWNDEWGA